MSENTQQTTDEESDEQPYIVELGAGEREPADTVNVSVESTVGPDFLGQESVDIDGHPKDKPGVQNRLPENGVDERDPRISRMDTGEELPVLLSSNIETVVTEGKQGSYTEIIEGECNRCGYDRLRRTVLTMPHETQLKCNACHARQEWSAENGYYMPQTDKERADRARESGNKIGTVSGYEVYETPESMGPYIELINNNTVRRWRERDIAELYYKTLRARDDVHTMSTLYTLTEDLKDEYDKFDRAVIAVQVAPDEVETDLPELDALFEDKLDD